MSLISAIALGVQIAVLDLLVPRPRQVLEADSVAARRDVAPAVADQAYEIVIRGGVPRVSWSGGAAGRLYAETTIAQLGKLAAGASLADAVIRDWPAFKWRGFILDCGRNWQPVSAIKELLDFMAAYKLNLFHWHLTDYWGWRLESKSVPELNSDRATIRNVGKRYSQAEFLEVIDYAARLGITVMPEFDVPGHTHAFRQALGIGSMRDPKADRAIRAFLAEFVRLVPPERMPYIHLGTDEVRNEPEMVDPDLVRAWARCATSAGHAVVGWAPGIDLGGEGVRYVRMQWGSKDESEGYPFLDMTGRYIDIVDPFELLPMAAYAKPCPWVATKGMALGALIGGWHDDILAAPEQYFRNNPVFPAIVLNADAFWCGRERDRPEFRARLPRPDDPAFALAADLERRVVAQRDRVLGKDFRRPFAFLAQTGMRWRLAYEDGETIATDVPQVTIHAHYFRSEGCSYVPATNRTVIAETWIRSPREQTVGAWIGFTALSRSSGRAVDGPTPKRGEWNRYGAKVELNGAELPPPEWTNPGLGPTAEELRQKHYWSFAKCSNVIPWTDEEYFMRKPYPIRLKEGWNHVKLTLPPSGTTHVSHWVGTFIPLMGTSEHPCEVPGLEYRSTLK